MPKCDECGREFGTEAALSQHLRDKHRAEASQGERASSEPRQSRRQKSLRRRNRHPVAMAVAAVAVALVLGIYFLAAPSFAQPPYPCSTEGAYDHVHPYLQIWIDGKNVSIPADVGILGGGSCTEPVHTHDASGILHLELSQSQAAQNWTLDNFFSIWKFSCSQGAQYCPTVNGAQAPVVFTPTDILGFTTNTTDRVVLLVDGAPSTQWGSLNLLEYDYCSASVANVPPCSPTAGGDPAWQYVSANQHGTYPFGTGHKIVIEYTTP